MLGVLVCVTIIVAIAAAFFTVSPLATGLFGILQFVFSLGFAYVITRNDAKGDFSASQKASAIAAYRRINEIAEGIDRILKVTRGSSPTLESADARHELAVVSAIADGVKGSIASLVADWGDIIGTEIQTVQNIEALELAADPEPSQAAEKAVTGPASAEISARHIRRRFQSGEVTRMLDSLPPTLRIMVEERSREASDDRYLSYLDKELVNTDTVEFEGFWDPSFKSDIRTFGVGDRLEVRISSVGHRPNSVCVHDADGTPAGVLTSKVEFSTYRAFRNTLLEFISHATFPVAITSIDPVDFEDRHYFCVALVPEAITKSDIDSIIQRLYYRNEAVKRVRSTTAIRTTAVSPNE